MVLAMEHEEKQPKCSSSNGGGSRGSSKKNKPKKIPQRGLGVAQLEKIRLEEQQKNNINNVGSSSSNPSPGIILPVHQQPSMPFLTADSNPLFRPIADPNPILKPSIPISSAIDFFSSTPLPVLDSSPMVTAASGSTGHGFLPMLWNATEQSSQDVAETNRKFSFHASMLPGDSSSSNLSWESTGLLQRKQLPPPPLQLVNKALSPSSSGVYLSSGVNIQIEPPSNQSYSSNYLNPSSWQGDVRMVGTKRPWPFYPNTIPGHSSLACRIPPFPTGFSGGASSSSPFQADWRSSELCTDKRVKETGASTDDGFLSLGPSLTQQSILRPRQPMLIPPSVQSDHPEFSLLPSHVGGDDASSRSQGSLQQPFYSFLPGPTTPTTTFNEQSSEASDVVDLNLKL